MARSPVLRRSQSGSQPRNRPAVLKHDSSSDSSDSSDLEILQPKPTTEQDYIIEHRWTEKNQLQYHVRRAALHVQLWSALLSPNDAPLISSYWAHVPSNQQYQRYEKPRPGRPPGPKWLERKRRESEASNSLVGSWVAVGSPSAGAASELMKSGKRKAPTPSPEPQDEEEEEEDQLDSTSEEEARPTPPAPKSVPQPTLKKAHRTPEEKAARAAKKERKRLRREKKAERARRREAEEQKGERSEVKVQDVAGGEGKKKRKRDKIKKQQERRKRRKLGRHVEQGEEQKQEGVVAPSPVESAADKPSLGSASPSHPDHHPLPVASSSKPSSTVQKGKRETEAVVERKEKVRKRRKVEAGAEVAPPTASTEHEQTLVSVDQPSSTLPPSTTASKPVPPASSISSTSSSLAVQPLPATSTSKPAPAPAPARAQALSPLPTTSTSLPSKTAALAPPSPPLEAPALSHSQSQRRTSTIPIPIPETTRHLLLRSEGPSQVEVELEEQEKKKRRRKAERKEKKKRRRKEEERRAQRSPSPGTVDSTLQQAKEEALRALYAYASLEVGGRVYEYRPRWRELEERGVRGWEDHVEEILSFQPAGPATGGSGSGSGSEAGAGGSPSKLAGRAADDGAGAGAGKGCMCFVVWAQDLSYSWLPLHLVRRRCPGKLIDLFEKSIEWHHPAPAPKSSTPTAFSSLPKKSLVNDNEGKEKVDLRRAVSEGSEEL